MPGDASVKWVVLKPIGTTTCPEALVVALTVATPMPLSGGGEVMVMVAGGPASTPASLASATAASDPPSSPAKTSALASWVDASIPVPGVLALLLLHAAAAAGAPIATRIRRQRGLIPTSGMPYHRSEERRVGKEGRYR